MLEFKNETSTQPSSFINAVDEFKRKCMFHDIALHGFLVLRNDSVLAEEYFFPYTKDTCHRMYSVTKSLTSMAIGILISEGKISLSDQIYKYFTGKYDLSNIHPYLKELTIENMLTMQTCFYKTTYNENEDYDWAKSYFTTTPDHKPGTVFSYDTSSSQVLAALVEDLTGMSLLDYLKIKLFNELGLSKEISMLTDPSGVAQGGTGFLATLRDLAKIAYLVNNLGSINGKELISSDYLKVATKKLTPTSILTSSHEETYGYGYMFWKSRYDGFVMYGMGGQLAICFPELHFCMLTIADTIGFNSGLQTLYDCFYDTIFKCLFPDTYSLSPNTFVCTVYPIYNGEYTVTASNTCFTRITLTDSALTLVDGQNRKNTFKYSLKESVKFYMDTINRECSSFSFIEDNHLYIKCFITDIEQGHIFFDIYNKENTITIRIENTSSKLIKDFKGCLTAVEKV